MRIHPPIFVTLAIALSSCTGAQMEARRMTTTANETVAAKNACTQSILENKDYQAILTKVYVMIDPSLEPPLAMLADKSIPTKQELRILYRLHDDMLECRKIHLDGSSKVSPLISAQLV
jgi:hypothetical protein